MNVKGTFSIADEPTSYGSFEKIGSETAEKECLEI